MEQTKRGVRSALPPPHQKRIRIYGTLPRLPLGNAAIFKEAGSRGALIQRQTTQCRARSLAHLHAQAHFLLGETQAAQLISARALPPLPF